MAFVGSFAPRAPTSSSLSKSSFAPLVHTRLPRQTLLPNIPASCPKTDSPRMLFGFTLFPLPDVVGLPQNDKDPKGRVADLEECKERYIWSREVIGDTPMLEGVPREEVPAVGWVQGMAKTIFRIISNNLAVKYSDAREDLQKERTNLVYKIGSIASYVLQKLALGRFDAATADQLSDDVNALFGAKLEGEGLSFQEYKDLFMVYKPDRVAQLDQFLRDDIFGWYRVAGPSPMHLRKLTGDVKEMFPDLSDDIMRGIKGFTGDTLEEARKENRLFYVDYKEFDGVPSGTLPDGTKKDNLHLYGPTGLLAVPKVVDDRTSILPIAIRCGQSSEYPMYTANPSHTDPVTWLAAKCTVQVADAVMLETRYHLGRTHLLLEIFICAMRRTLAPNHPLLEFMSVHFEGTAFINYLGSLRLASAGGTIDVITAPQIEVTTSLCADAIRAPFKFNDWMPDVEMASRGMLDADRLNYPYRDDAMPIWHAILEWVDAYVRAYYKSDQDVVEDYELANWCREIVDPACGAIPGFGDTEDGQIKTIAYLVRFIATLVFIGSAQHAALNFPQGTLMQFVPAMPMAGGCPPPKTAKPFQNVDHFIKEMIPDLGVAQRQLNTAELLAAFQWTSLGEYGRDLNFAPDEVDEAMNAFKERLSDIGAQIQLRNRKERIAGLPVYDFLVPKNIPQSANV